MGLLDELTGGGGAASQFSDFISRYQQGAPHEGLEDREVADRYNQVAGEVDPDTYESAAQESFSRMDPESRGQFASMLQQHAASQGYDVGYDGSTDPASLAAMTRQVHTQNPGLLGSLLGGMGGSGGGLGGGLGGGGLGGALGGGGGVGGLASELVRGGGMGGGMGGGLGAMAGNPVARAALGGIAAMVARQVMNR